MQLLAIKTLKPNDNARISRLEIGISWYSQEYCDIVLRGTILGLLEKEDTLRFYFEGKAEPHKGQSNNNSASISFVEDEAKRYEYSVVEVSFPVVENINVPIHFDFAFSLQTKKDSGISVYLGNAKFSSIEELRHLSAENIPIDVLDLYCFRSKTSENVTFYPQQRIILSALEESIRNLHKDTLEITDQLLFAWNKRGVTAINPFEVNITTATSPLVTEKKPSTAPKSGGDGKEPEKLVKRNYGILVLAAILILVCVLVLILIAIGKNI